MKINYKDFALFLENKSDKNGMVIIAIDGPGGSGKSFFTNHLSDYLSYCQVIHFDDFYYERNSRQHTRTEIGSNFDWHRLEKEVLEPLKEGNIAYYQKYDWIKDKAYGKYQVKPEGIILIEGIYSFRKEIRTYYDLSIWIEVDYRLRLDRGINRDGEGMRGKWIDEWMPKENEYLESEFHNPRGHADIIIHGKTNDLDKYDNFDIIKTKLDFR